MSRDDAPPPDLLTHASGHDAIPMLTEIVPIERYPTQELPTSPAEVDWAALAERVRGNVEERLVRRTQTLLDSRFRDSLHAIVDRAADTLATEFRTSLEQLVRDLVDRTITEELTRLHTEISRRQA